MFKTFFYNFQQVIIFKKYIYFEFYQFFQWKTEKKLYFLGKPWIFSRTC